jgi:transcriptional regulator with GAF, ATPase, and Fis domain
MKRSGSERNRRRLWWLAAILMIGLATTVAILGASQVGQDEPVALPRESFTAILVAMVGLVALFALYAGSQHERLESKERDLARLAAHETILRERLNELSALLEMSGQLAQKLDVRGVLNLAASRLLPCLEADHSAVFLIDPRSGLLEEVASVGKQHGIAGPAKVSPGDGVIGYVYATGESLTIDSEEMLARLALELGLAVAPHAALCAPIRFEKSLLGVICVARIDVQETFAALHANALQALAEHCGAAIFKSFHYQCRGAGLRKAA